MDELAQEEIRLLEEEEEEEEKSNVDTNVGDEIIQNQKLKEIDEESIKPFKQGTLFFFFSLHFKSSFSFIFFFSRKQTTQKKREAKISFN